VVDINLGASQLGKYPALSTLTSLNNIAKYPLIASSFYMPVTILFLSKLFLLTSSAIQTGKLHLPEKRKIVFVD